jgi:hypothetical protein
MEKYKPIYAKGEILVYFKPVLESPNSKVKIDENFARVYGDLHHIEFRGFDDLDTAVYLTPPGRELEICRRLRRDKKRVESADRRDLKLVHRMREYDQILDLVNDVLEAEYGVSDKQYKENLETIIERLKQGIKNVNNPFLGIQISS